MIIECCICMLLVVALVLPMDASADKLDSLYVDELTGFNIATGDNLPYNTHHGDTSAGYTIAESSFNNSSDANALQKLNNALETGRLLWGSYISFAPASSSNGNVNIQFANVQGIGDVAHVVQYVPSSQGMNHMHPTLMEIFPVFYTFSGTAQAGTIGHEIGHVFGLGENANGSIMAQAVTSWGQNTPSPSQQEFRGLSLVTHVHTHDADNDSSIVWHWDYSPLTSDTNNHMKRCSYCLAYEEVNHNFSYTYNSSQHWRRCNKCGYELSKSNHGNFSYTNHSSTQHLKKCGTCNHSVLTTHNTTYYQHNAAQHKKRCSYCLNSYTYENHNFVYSGGIYQCNKCWYREGTKKIRPVIH